jgi:hypothetical protein
MVTKMLKKMTLITLFSLFLVGCNAMGNPFINRDSLLFENYYQNGIKLPKECLLDRGNIYFNDNLLVNRKILLQTQGEKIIGTLFDVLCNLDIINRWNSYKDSDINPYSYKREEFVEKMKKELDLFYLGKLKLSNNFNSYLIVVSTGITNNYNVIKTVFLINETNNKIVSITRMSQYTLFDGDGYHIYTEMSKKGIFMQKGEQFSSDVILPKEMRLEQANTSIKFIYNKKGFLERL